jgi:hypothetical protein
MQKKEVTQGQFLGLWHTAKDLGIDRGMFEEMLPCIVARMKERRDQILADGENCITFELSAIVHQGQSYIEALVEGAPSTSSDYDSRKVGDLYPPTSDKEEKVDFVLRNFPKGRHCWEKALKWAKSKGYKTTNPREVFAVTKQHNLRKLLKRSRLYLVATEKCLFNSSSRAVGVISDSGGRWACLYDLSGFGVGDGWFLFRK